MDYFHSKNQFLQIGVADTLDLLAPRPFTFGSTDDSREYAKSNFVILSNNHKIGIMYLGYGISYSKNTWNFEDSYDNIYLGVNKSREKTHNTFGLFFPIHYQYRKNFNIGLIYRPTFYIPNGPSTFVSEHLISFDFGWKIKILK